jgi:AcrR family transcriptional regulator
VAASRGLATPAAGHTPTVSEQALRQLRASRQRHVAETRELIFAAALQGATSHQIADALGVSRATLWRRHREELRRAAALRDGPDPAHGPERA